MNYTITWTEEAIVTFEHRIAYLKKHWTEKEIKKFNSTDEYVESLTEKSKFKIISADISNIDSLDQPVTEKFQVEGKEYSSMDHDHFKFGLITKKGQQVSDYEKKIEHYTAYLAKQKQTAKKAA